jgi:hypothetical protein
MVVLRTFHEERVKGGFEGLKTTSIVDSPNPSYKIPLLIPGIRFLPLPDGLIRMHNKKICISSGTQCKV